MATNPLGFRPYYGMLSATFIGKQSVMDLLKAAYAALAQPQAIPALTGAQVTLYAPAGNSASVLIGDAAISLSNYARVLPKSTATFISHATYGPFETSDVPLQNIYVMSASEVAEAQIGIEVQFS